MNTLTFTFDVQLNDQEDWIAEGTQVKVSDNPFHINRWEDSIPVIITEAYNYEGEKVVVPGIVEWFMKSSFKEFKK